MKGRTKGGMDVVERCGQGMKGVVRCGGGIGLDGLAAMAEEVKMGLLNDLGDA